MTNVTPDMLHDQYSSMKDVWKTCRDCRTGQRAIKKGGESYLPKIYSAQSDVEYKSYLTRALFMNATGRTVDGMVGLIFRKYPTISLPDALKEYESDITMGGLSLSGLARSIVEDVITVARAGVLVDFPPTNTQERVTIDAAKTAGLRPYITPYKAEQIKNWEYGRVNNKTMLIRVFLEETDPEDQSKVIVRELHMDDGAYAQRIWRGTAVISEAIPLINGQRIMEIPFWFCQPKEGGGDVQDPPIESLAYVNLAHYRNSADLENGVHIAGLPTPYVTGVEQAGMMPELHLGTGTFVGLPTGETAGFIQCGEEGFAAIEKAMDRKEAQMAQLGARILSPEKAAAETEGALEIKRGGENSVLAALASSVEDSLTKALRFMAAWVGSNQDEAFIELNKDYIPSHMTAQDLQAWIAAWQGGSVSYETFFTGLQRGELVPESLTAEDERAKIDADGPKLAQSRNPIEVV